MGRKPKHGEGVVRFNMSLTPTAKEKLDARAKALGTTRADLIEKFARGELPLEESREVNQVMGET